MPPKRAPPVGYERARRLRKAPTPAEAKLWAYLRGNKLQGVSFRRQHAIGRYVVDFCSPKKRLVIELDGRQHLELTERDAERTAYLEAQGYRVIRFWNDQVAHDIGGVMRVIESALGQE